jgi:hypothetical protein
VKLTGLWLVLPLGLAACTRGDGADIEKRLDKIDERIAALEASAGRPGPNRPGPDRREMARPDPNVTYAVPIEGSHYEGPQHAKVTLVEGFEFA